MRPSAFFGCLIGGDGGRRSKDKNARGDGKHSSLTSPASVGRPGSNGRSSNFKAPEPGGRMQPEDLEAAMEKVRQEVRPWDKQNFVFVKHLQEALRNHGRVDLMQNMDEGGINVAVKRMPCKWVKSGPSEFAKHYPSSSEKPWLDFGLVRYLNEIGYPYACRLMGVFRGSEETFVVTTFCTEGDFFGWCDRRDIPKPGKAREKAILPFAVQILTAVRYLHDLGIAHRDLSLENVLLQDLGKGRRQVCLIDFGMATLSQTVRRELRGKQSYQAPEMHLEADFETFPTDNFAVGVMLFAMAAQDYPWTNTKRNMCQLFEYVTTFGLKRFLDKRKLRRGNGECLAQVFTVPFADLLEGMLQVSPKYRVHLGEAIYTEQESKTGKSVWDFSWLEGAVLQPPPYTPRPPDHP